MLYRQYLASKGMKRKGWAFARRVAITLLGDPRCTLVVHGRRLKLPLSHSLPDFLEQFPSYDRLPGRLSSYIHATQGYLHCIDVGANIGDTIAAFYMNDADTFLAIEPNPTFNTLLTENWGWNTNVTLVPVMCSSDSGEGRFAIQEKDGTASILQQADGVVMTRKPLDEITRSHPPSAAANVVKIDTDGHDFEVIAGARRLLSQNLPALLFECDVFKNTRYVEECLRTLDLLRECGYGHFLLYDNRGNLMGRHSLSDLVPFRNLLFFQLTSDFYYFDILVMKDDDVANFYRTEVAHFANTMPDRSLQRTALAAAGV
jgi:FkbM family methyltransferase